MSLPTIAEALKAIPKPLAEPLIAEFQQALDEYRAGDWEKVGLKAGKFCEIAYCICQGHATGNFPAKPSKPQNFPQACRNLEQYNGTRGRSLCMQVPKVLTALYELRNNRAIGHISSEIEPNHMDADFYIRSMKWIMSELVRNYSSLPLDFSRNLVEAITARTFSIVWTDGNIRRVLEPARSASQKALILLYAEGRPMLAATLQSWVEYKNSSEFRTKVIKPLHKKALVHFDEAAGTVQILPSGQILVERSGWLVFA